MDAAGNVYIAGANNNAIKEWNAATQQVSTLVSGLNYPEGVAVDAAGMSITDAFNGAVKKFSPGFIGWRERINWSVPRSAVPPLA